MSRWRSIWLVARREILERGRSRGFILSVFFTTALVVGSFLIPSLLFKDDETTTVGVVQPAPAGLETAVAATATQLDRQVDVVPYPDATAADAALDAGEVDAVVDVPADLSTPGSVRFQQDVDQATAQLLSASVVALRMSGSRPSDGSSRMAISGSCWRAWTMPTFWRIPRE